MKGGNEFEELPS